MGSLMAGWSSPSIDEHKARAQRNNSLTKEEINHFWKSQKKTDGEEGNFSFSPYGSPSQLSPVFLTDEEKRKAISPFSRSYKDSWLTDHLQSGPNSPRIVESENQEDQMTGKPDKTGDWWTRSNWAFLNEPPLDDTNGVAHKYTAQFNVARLASDIA
ncbi:hypothetical protein LUZ60_011281 [Juncus effusus]|nr:hypothetical protein LUZ60_011281 [Juncus effusus]